MKYVYLTMTMVITLHLSLAQPPKNSKRIIIKHEATAEEAFNVIGRKLMDQGYEIANSNKDFLTIKTADKQVKGLNAYTYYVVTFKEGTIELTGKITLPSINEGVYDEIENKGMKGSPLKRAFEEMDALASRLGTVAGYQ